MRTTEQADDPAIRAIRKNLIRYIPVVHRLEDGSVPYPAPHHQVWCSVLMDDSLGHTLIVAPPGHAKTNIAGIYYPAWYIGNNPYKHVLYIGNTEGAGTRQSLAVRDTVADNPRYRGIFPDVRPNKAKGWGQNNWFVQRPTLEDKDATFYASGVYGDVLGRRCDRLLLDDVMDEENSATAYQREKLANWIATTAMSRLVPGGRCICIMTRWHEEDIAEWCRTRGFSVVHMPALSDGPDVVATIKRYNFDTQKDVEVARILVHENGPALWPDLFTEAELNKRRIEFGEANFAKMYQGVPVPSGGAIFKDEWWQTWDFDQNILPHMSVKIQTWDTAFQEKTTSDWSVCCTWGLGIDGRMYLIDLWRDRVPFPRLKEKAYELYAQWRPSQVVIEERASGQSLIQELQQARDGSPAIPVIPHSDKNRDKVMRANSVTGYVQSGMVRIPRSDLYNWVPKFRAELAFFPAGAHDDQVDAAVIGIMRLANYTSPALPDEFFDEQETIMGNIFSRQW